MGIAIGSKIKKIAPLYMQSLAMVNLKKGKSGRRPCMPDTESWTILSLLLITTSYKSTGQQKKINSLGDLRAKWESFGWFVQKINGHDHLAIYAAIERAKNNGHGGPAMIILDTIKGKGVSFVEAAGGSTITICQSLWNKCRLL